MKYKYLVLISFLLMILSLAAVSASDLNQSAISDSSYDSSIIADSVSDSSLELSVIADSVSDSSLDDSLVIDENVPELPSGDGDEEIPIDSNEKDITIDNDDSSINSDITDDDSIISNMTNDIPSSNLDNSPISNIRQSTGSFDELQSLIDSFPAGVVLCLNRDYKATKDKQVTINKNLVIDGQGHTIDCDKKCRAFYSSSGVCTIRNLKFINGFINGNCPDDNSYFGGAVCIEGTAQYTFEDCEFDSNCADDKGGAISNRGRLLTIRNCIFKNNCADDVIGGAIYSSAEIIVENSIFNNNSADNSGGAIALSGDKKSYISNSQFNSNYAKDNGGAISALCDIYVYDCSFSNNLAGIDGGAIFCFANTTVEKCLFESNKVVSSIVDIGRGGAICTLFGNLYVNNSTFKNNWADDCGGAIYSGGKLYINYDQNNSQDYNTFFIGNTADSYGGGAINCYSEAFIKNVKFSSNKAWTDGGAISGSKGLSITHCLFDSNRCEGSAGKCKGGAIFGNSTVSLFKCIFNNNYAENYGGAVFSDSTAYVDACTFDSNSAKTHGGAIYANAVDVGSKMYGKSYFRCNKALNENGGAIYAVKSLYAMDAVFNSNTALVDGGAIFSKGDVKLNWCNFDSNRAEGALNTKCYGGAIRASNLKLFGSSFVNNYAENHGGAIYTDTFSGDVSDCTFKGNKAGTDGGAVYVNGKNIFAFTKCVFVDNHAGDEGGAVYLDSTKADLYLVSNVFIGNSAKNGQAVFNKGSYSVIKNNWWGGADPTKDDNILVEWNFWTSNVNRVDADPLELVLKFETGFIKLGDTVRATAFYIKSNGEAFTGNIPIDISLYLPEGIEEISSGKTSNSIYIDLVADMPDIFVITAESFGAFSTAKVLVVRENA